MNTRHSSLLCCLAATAIGMIAVSAPKAMAASRDKVFFPVGGGGLAGPG